MVRSVTFGMFFLYVVLLRAEPIAVSTEPPGDLDPEDVPQLIFITFDDSTTATMYDGIQLINGHTNPDGSPVAFTFYVSLDSPDFYNVHRLHAEGHEIAAHTVTHTTGNSSSLEVWGREIASCKEGLARFAKIPAEDIRGFRAPFLAYNQHTFKILHDMGFEYDTSVPESANGLNSEGADAFIWPYHLHNGMQQTPHTGTPPDESLPGLMEIPMWQLQKVAGGEHNMDPSEPTKQAMVDMLKLNFTTRYESNRVPVAIWNHAGWMSSSDNVDALNEFLTWALAHDDVWVVPVVKMVDWMKNPLPVTDPAHEDLLTVATYDPIPESEVINNVIGTAYVRTVEEFLPDVPSPTSLMKQLIPIETGVQLELKIVSDWGSGFQAVLVATNPTDTAYSFWTGTLTPATATLPKPWNVSHSTNADGSIQVQSMGAQSTPIEANANEQVLATYWAQGSSAGVTLDAGSILIPETIAPVLGRSSEGHLEWDHTAPLYEVQKRSGLVDGEWQTIRTQYGVTGMDVAEEESDSLLFYRIKAVP